MRRGIGVGALCVWGALMVWIGAIMLGRHLVALPAQTGDDAALAAALSEARSEADSGWFAAHALYGECGCSRRVAAHLLESERPSDVRELVILVGDDPELRSSLIEKGFEVDVVTREELAARYHLRAVPVLAVLDPLDRVRYVGGYTQRKQGPVIEDLEILANLQSDRSIAALPLFGCAVSRRLQQTIDPTGLF